MVIRSDTNRGNLQPLKDLLGEAEVRTWEELTPDQQTTLASAIAPTSRISGIAYPKTQTELAAVVEYAQQHRWPMLPCGAGSKLHWGGLVTASEQILVISTQHLNRLIEHAVGDLTVTVEAGMGFAELQKTLAGAGQFLAIDPAYPNQATIGGVIATGDTGSLRQRYNSVRDMVLGLNFVRADGQLVKAGGRVVKNVAGYDLMKLLTGSYGTLGLITQITLRVYPLPETSQTLGLSGTATAIAETTSILLSSTLTPTAIDLVNQDMMADLGLGDQPGVIVRFQGISPSVQEQAKRLREIGQKLSLTSHSLTPELEQDLWQRLPEAMAPGSNPKAITCKIGVRPTTAVALLSQIDSLVDTRWSGQIHGASGLGKLMFDSDSLSPTTLEQIRILCQDNGGFLSILQAPVEWKQQLDVWGYTGNALALMGTLKRQFDPNVLLSPQRFIGGI